MRWIGILFLLMLLILGGRLFDIQVVRTTHFSAHNIDLIKESVAQRTETFVLDEGRGTFIDRNDAPWQNEQLAILVFPSLASSTDRIDAIAEATQLHSSDIIHQIEVNEGPFFLQKDGKLIHVQKNRAASLAVVGHGGFLMIPTSQNEQSLASHVIGTLGENDNLLQKRYPEEFNHTIVPATETGVSGLQQAFDELLISRGKEQLLYHVDLFGHPIFGSEMKYMGDGNTFYPLQVQLTLDKQIQAVAEHHVDQSHLKKGGVVVLDIATNEVLAMVSRPKKQQDAPLEGPGALNYMTEPAFPGSIFKIVTAAAAIDHLNIHDRMFDCDKNMYGDGPEVRELGKLSFADSFAQSCNNTFATLANELMAKDPTILETYARKLGVTQKAGFEGNLYKLHSVAHFPDEALPTLWGDEADKYVEKAISQTAIGQKNVKITPLGIANMMAAIARQGPVYKAKAVREIQYKNGQPFYLFPSEESAEGLAMFTYKKLNALLAKVVTDGTGQSFQTIKGGVAGKSGTAETGHGADVHKWFAGYYPLDQPRFAVVVVALDTSSGDDSAYNTFRKLGESLVGVKE